MKKLRIVAWVSTFFITATLIHSGFGRARADQQYSPQEIARRTFPSVLMIIVNDAAGQPLALGSGFVIQDGIIVTNRHVIEGSSSGYVKLIGEEKQHAIEGIISDSARYDLALLSVPSVMRPALALSTINPSVGDTIYAIGNPRGLEGTFSQGIVSSVRKVGNDDLIQITAPISPGSSGGPVVNSRNEVIGVATATISEGQNLNFAVPAVYLGHLLKSEKKAIRLLDVKKTPSYTSNFGRGAKSGIKCGQFLWNNDIQNNVPGQKSSFSFTIRNELNVPIKNLEIRLIFYDKDSQPLDVFTYRSPGSWLGLFGGEDLVILPGLAKRVEGNVDFSVKKLTTNKSGLNSDFLGTWADRPYTKYEFRVMGFDIVQ